MYILRDPIERKIIIMYDVNQMIQEQKIREQFEKEVISPLSNKTLKEITSYNLIYNQARDVFRTTEAKARDLKLYPQ